MCGAELGETIVQALRIGTDDKWNICGEDQVKSGLHRCSDVEAVGHYIEFGGKDSSGNSLVFD